MSLQIIRADITNLPFPVDVIVNSADTETKYNFGVDRAIYQAAGEKELLLARQIIGEIALGKVRATDSFGLKDKAKKIFHVVTPIYFRGDKKETSTLRECYQECFKLLVSFQENFSSIAFPILGAGNNRFPIKEALRIAIAESVRFLLENDNHKVILVTFDKDVFQKCKKIFPNFVKERISNSEVQKRKNEDESAGASEFRRNQSTRNVKTKSLDKNFITKLSEFMQRIGLDIENRKDLIHIIRRGRISDKIRQTIRERKKDGEKYNPQKENVIRFAIALQLSLEDTAVLLNSAGHALYDGSDLDRRLKNFIYRYQNNPRDYTIENMEKEIPEYRI